MRFVVLIFLFSVYSSYGQMDSASAENVNKKRAQSDFSLAVPVKIFSNSPNAVLSQYLISPDRKSEFDPRRINLNLNYYFEVYPLENYYVSGRYFMTMEGPYRPPFHIRDQHLIIPRRTD